MKSRSSINMLLKIASEPTGLSSKLPSAIPKELHGLYEKNGFLAFESALEVFPAGESRWSYPLEEWNDEQTWKSCYQDMAPQGLCFAQDLFGTQFLLCEEVYYFNPETAELSFGAKSVEAWAKQVLADYRVMTAQPLANAWQVQHGPLPERKRLVPIIPFVLGGPYEIDNLMAMDAVEAMHLRASLALQIRDLPDGAEVTYEVE